MNKNDMINEVMASLTVTLNQEQLEIVKATFIVKMQGYEIHEICLLPSTEVRDNDFIFKRFMVDMLAKGLKESTIKSYMNLIKPFFDYTNLNYRDVTAQVITDYLAVRKVTANANGKKNTQTYISNICRVLFVFFQWAYRKHHIEEDIMRDVDRIKPKQKRKERLTNEEVETCRELLNGDREKALFELMLSTGMRVGEIVKLKIEDIDFQSRKIQIHGEKTENADRDGYLSIRARNAILKYTRYRKQGYVFRPERNTLEEDVPMGTGAIEKIAKDIGKRAKVHCKSTVHTFRRTFASETYRKTGDVKLVSILLGHAHTAVTEKYYLVDDMQDIRYKALSVA